MGNDLPSGMALSMHQQPTIGELIQDKDKQIAELERKLAEQQAMLRLAKRQLNWTALPEIDAALKNQEELNKLLAAAKEEGRREAVPEGWQVTPKRATLAMWFNGQDYATYEQDGETMLLSGEQVCQVYEAMLASAPKPQGETK